MWQVAVVWLNGWLPDFRACIAIWPIAIIPSIVISPLYLSTAVYSMGVKGDFWLVAHGWQGVSVEIDFFLAAYDEVVAIDASCWLHLIVSTFAAEVVEVRLHIRKCAHSLSL